MKKVDYLEIIKKSWKITWKNKFLWWFGLFLALGGGASFNFPGNSEWNNKIGENEDKVASFINQHWQIIIVAIVLAVILGLALFVLSLISKAGLIKTLDKIEKNLSGNFKEGFREGKKYFWKILAVGLILGIFIFALLVVLSFPVIFLFYVKSVVLGILFAFLAVAIFIPLVILASFIGKYSIFYLVLSDLGIKASIENGYQVFKKNILASVIMALFFIPINIILFVMAAISFLIVGLIFLPIGIMLYLALAKIGVIVAVALGGFIFVIFLILVNSVFQVFYQTVWFLFFKEIASVKMEEKVEENVVEIVEKNIPTPEEV
jgi:MFS family permease